MSRDRFWPNVEKKMGYMPWTAFARRLDLSYSTVFSWKKGHRVPAGDVCVRIADLLECDVKELFDGAEQEVKA